MGISADMAAQVLSFFQRSPRHTPSSADWSQQELAEFYRVESALLRAGIRVGTDRGLSDEKEPWFVFYRTDDGEVVIHFARIDGEYLIAGPAYDEIARGFDFSSMVRNMVARHPLIRRSDRGDNIAIHPAALLVAVVGTAFFKSGEARAAESGSANPAQHSRPSLLISSSKSGLTAGLSSSGPTGAQPTYDTVQLPVSQAVLVMAAALLAAEFTVDSRSFEHDIQIAGTAGFASLDFGSSIGSSSVATAPAAAAAAQDAAIIANTSAHTVSSLLSLVALLSTLPHSSDLTLAPHMLRPAADTSRGSDSPAESATPLPHETANWALEVRLGSGALPNIEAVQLVRALVGDSAAAQKITVIEVSKLPDVLAEIISHGEHVQVAPVNAPAPDSQPSGSLSDTPVTPVESTNTSSHEAAANISPAVAPAPPAHTPIVSRDLVTQFINYFIEHTDHVGMMSQGQQVVIYDTRVMTDPTTIDRIIGLNFELDDHSGINLIGAQSAFLNGGFFA